VMGEVPGNLDVLQPAILLHGLQQYIDRQSILDSYAIQGFQLLQLQHASLLSWFSLIRTMSQCLAETWKSMQQQL